MRKMELTMPIGLLMRSTLTIFFFLLFFFFLPFLTLSYQIEANGRLKNYTRIKLASAVGPESIAFDCKGQGPYTGVSDGRILKWQGPHRGWTEFAVTSQHRRRALCDGSNDTKLESKCGRPLGLQFDKATCNLYIVDAYFGLMVVGPNGGTAKLLANSAEGVPFRFTNGLDIDHENGVVYFTDSSTSFQRWQYMLLVWSGDRTGRLMKYDIRSKKLTVLLKGLAYANGVSLSKDKDFILVGETTTSQILRFWLQGPKAKTIELFAQLPMNPDNIKTSAEGEFWVALNSGRGELVKPEATLKMTEDAVAVKLDVKGNILEVLNGNGGKTLESVSEVAENGGSLWIGSVIKPYVSLYKV